MKLADLAGRRVAVWGFGREGKAVLSAFRSHVPGQALTLYCTPDEAARAQACHPALTVYTDEPDAAALADVEVLIKSPGISAYKPQLLAACAQGLQVTSGTALWFAEHPQARVVAVTGTKGKSTTSALLAHVARATGIRTALAGNIGLPLLELLGQQADLWVLELSSFQTGEAGVSELGVITSLDEEHLDWHGSRLRYVADKLRLMEVSRRLLINAQQPVLRQHTEHHPWRVLFGHKEGWHVANGFIYRAARQILPLPQLPISGLHNALNACAALAAWEELGFDAIAAAPALATFRPLPHRLQRLGRHAWLDYVNDSISTTPQATLAALESLPGRAVTVLLGGYERGLDWTPFVQAMRDTPPQAIICMGANGARIETALRQAGVGCPVRRAADLAEAILQARLVTPAGGTVLLSPGAPSFDQFHDYAERGRRFAELAGFDAAAITEISGLGVA